MSSTGTPAAVRVSISLVAMSTRSSTLDGAAEARLVAEACSPPPKGRARWTLKLLADRLVELEIVESIGTTTVHETLKKTNSNRGKKNNG